MNYGKAFRELREENGFSRADVAKQIGCTPSALSKIENGKTVPKEKTIAKFCLMTRTPMARFYTLALEKDDFSLVSIGNRLTDKDVFSTIAMTRATEFAMSLAENIDQADDPEYVLKLMDKVGLLDGDEQVEEQPRRYLPVTCSDKE